MSIVVIGAAVIDLKGTPTHPPQLQTSNAGVVRQSWGGVGRNIAENLARLGRDVSLLSVVGDDQLGAMLIAAGAAAGIDVSTMQIVPNLRSGTYLSILDDSKELVIAINDFEIMQHLNLNYLQQHQPILSSAAYLVCDLNLPSDALGYIISVAAQYAVPLVVDTTSRVKAERIRPFLEHVHILAPNRAEATNLCEGIDSADHMALAQALRNAGVDIVLLSLGAEGLCLAYDDVIEDFPAHTIEIADSTGAGDALLAGFIWARANGYDMRHAARFGQACAAHTLQQTDTVSSELSSTDILYILGDA